MTFLLALTLALDQRIEIQFLLLLALCVYSARRTPRSKLNQGKATIALVAATGYLIVNSVVTLTDPVGVSSGWWAAPVRIGLFYVMLVMLATIMSSSHFDGERAFVTLEWLFLIKLLIAALEGWYILKTGEPRERPLFNVILSSDSLIGVRLTSSYDVLFATLALSSRRPAFRLLLLACILVLTETRALVLLSLLFLGWRMMRERSPWLMVAGLALPVAIMLGAIMVLAQQNETSSRLTQVEGSSLDDKIEQIDAVTSQLNLAYLVTGRGLGASLPNVIRDENRPYSYEAQVPVLLWQGGLMFFVTHLGILWAYGIRKQAIGIFIILLLATLNPTLFSLSSGFLIIALGKLSMSRRHAILKT